MMSFLSQNKNDELEEILDNSKITDDHLQAETIGPSKFETYKNLETEKGTTDVYIILF